MQGCFQSHGTNHTIPHSIYRQPIQTSSTHLSPLLLLSLMAKFLITFLSIFLLMSQILLISSQSFGFIYNGFKQVRNNISLNNAAEIETNGLLRLTNYTRRVIGRAFYPSPLLFKKSNKVVSFSTCFAFVIVPEYPKLGGHGFAFTISPTKDFQGAHPSQYLGLFNSTTEGNFSNHVFAVEFDTVKDFEFFDIDDNHVGINVNSMQSNASVSAFYYTLNLTQQGLKLKSGKIIQAWVDYDSIENLLTLRLSPSSEKPNFPILSLPVDLSPIFKNVMYIGFSSSTGLLASSHYILGWSFKMGGFARSLDISSLPSLPGSKKQNRGLIIGFSIVSVFVVIVVICLSIYLIRKHKNKDPIEDWELNVGPHRFPYKELKIATKGFRDKGLLGFGGFGRVYKGVLPDSKTQIAVKRISHESKQGFREFITEISSMGRLRHRNLVQLHGWCRRCGDLLLVYEFMPNGSLDKFLYEDSKLVLTWEQRFKIIKGVASALVYLHEGWEQIVVHRDVKASNVLLDSELNSRLGDFGLATLYDHGSHPTTTRVVGTLGYLAPELTRTGKATTCSDVFAFGALVLEITCGRRPVEPKAIPEEYILVDWVWDKYQEGRVLEVVDPRLSGEYDEEEVLMVVKLGLMCSNNVPSARPTIRQVVNFLEREVRVPEVLSAPGAYESERNVDGCDDFEHSYPVTSFETGDLEAANVAGGSSPILLNSNDQA